MSYICLLNNNIFTGTIPSSLGLMSAINYIDFSNNLLNGLIPSELNKLNKLQELYLQNNLFSGNIGSFLDPIHQRYFNTLDISR